MLEVLLAIISIMFQEISFFFNDNQVLEKFRVLESLEYRIYLDYSQIDIFNREAIFEEISKLEMYVNQAFRKSVYSSFTIYSNKDNLNLGTYEFNHFYTQIFNELYYLNIPVIIIIGFFSFLFSNYLSNLEIDLWRKVEVFKSPFYIKRQLLLELLFYNICTFLIAIPFGVGLYIMFRSLFTQESIIYGILPTTIFYFLIIAFLFNIIYFLILSLFTLRTVPSGVTIESTEKHDLKRTFKHLRKFGIIIFVLLLFLSFLSLIFKLISRFYNNYFLLVIEYFITEYSNSFQYLYVYFLLGLVLLIGSQLIIKFISKLSIIPLYRYRNLTVEKVLSLRKFLTTSRKNILISVCIIGLGLGFINFYYFNRYNISQQEELEIYLDVGSDYKLYEMNLWYDTPSINYSYYFKNEQYSLINYISGKLKNYSISYPEYYMILTIDPMSYYDCLNNRSKPYIDPSFLSLLEYLDTDEILLPSYFQIRYGVKIGDTTYTSFS